MFLSLMIVFSIIKLLAISIHGYFSALMNDRNDYYAKQIPMPRTAINDCHKH